jgi:hypothetical protein
MAAISGLTLRVRWSQMRALISFLRSFNPWKVVAIIFALLNLKSLPLGWHVRSFSPLPR